MALVQILHLLQKDQIGCESLQCGVQFENAGAFGGAVARTSLTFLSQAAIAAGVPGQHGLKKQIVAVKGCRTVKKTDMVHNSYLPTMEIDAQTYAVRADGQLLTCEPAQSLPMAQRYFLF